MRRPPNNDEEKIRNIRFFYAYLAAFVIIYYLNLRTTLVYHE